MRARAFESSAEISLVGFDRGGLLGVLGSVLASPHLKNSNLLILSAKFYLMMKDKEKVVEVIPVIAEHVYYDN